MLYGTRDTLDAMSFWRAKAREIGAEFASAEFEFDIGEIEVGLTDRELLKKADGANKFLNLRRMKKSFQLDVLTEFQRYVNDEKGNVELMQKVSDIAKRPDLFSRLLSEDPELSQLDVLVIPVADDPAFPTKIRQLAFVRPGTKVVSVAQSSSKASIVLPSWMTGNEAIAKRDATRNSILMTKKIAKTKADILAELGEQPKSELPESSQPSSRRRKVRI